MQKKFISVLVENNAGVLTRISSLFCQRGFNIDSLTVSATDDETISRITIVATVDEQNFGQILGQTAKLHEVKAIFELPAGDSLLRELLLVKVSADESNRGALREISEIYKAKIIDLSAESMVFELTGLPDKMDGFLKVLGNYRILEMCRTGVTAMQRGPVTYTI